MQKLRGGDSAPSLWKEKAWKHSPKRRRLCKPGRPQFEDMGDELFDWITGKRDDGIAVHGKAIQSKVKEMLRSYYSEDAEFAASRGWLSRFFRRRKLVSRRATTVGQEIPGNAADVAERFMSDVKKSSLTANSVPLALTTWTRRRSGLTCLRLPPLTWRE